MPGQGPSLPATRVLLVEDDEALVALIRDVLVGEGFQVVVATRGDAAIATLERTRIDVALLDKELPGTNGLDLVEYLARRHPGLPTILMTAFGGALVARAAQERGASMYLDKPVRLDTLVAAVETASAGAAAAPVARPLMAPRPDRGEATAPAALWAAVLVRPHAARLEALLALARPAAVTAAGAEGKTLLRATLARTAPGIPLAHTVVVTGPRQAQRVMVDLAEMPGARLLIEPADRGSAVATLYPVHWIARRDPDATVVVMPHDHTVADARGFMAAVARAHAFVRREPGRVVVLAVPPEGPETEWGWVVPGDPLDAGIPVVHAVQRFVENPSRPQARALHAAGGLWSTSVVVARVSVLRDVGRQLLSPLHRGLAHAVALDGSEAGRHALRRTYRLVPPASLSAAVLQDSEPVLAVLPVEGLGWSDWGTPRRAMIALRRMGIAAPPGPVRPSGIASRVAARWPGRRRGVP